MFDAMEPPGSGTDDTQPCVSVSDLETLRSRLATMSPDGLSNGELVDLVQAAEAVKNALAGVQAALAVGLDDATRAAHAAAGMPARRQGTGVISELGLARRESFTQARRHLGLAKILATEMPHTLAALRAGVLSEWRATTIVRETACLSLEHRQTVDVELCAGPDRLHRWGDKQLAEETKKIAYRLDPHAVTTRAAKAADDRYVSFRPAPDTMVKITAMLPVTDGVAINAALQAAYEHTRCQSDNDRDRDNGGDDGDAGDGGWVPDQRTRGQIMADTLTHRITGRIASMAPRPSSHPGSVRDADSATGDRSGAGHGSTSDRGANAGRHGHGDGSDPRTTWNYPGKKNTPSTSTGSAGAGSADTGIAGTGGTAGAAGADDAAAGSGTTGKGSGSDSGTGNSGESDAGATGTVTGPVVGDGVKIVVNLLMTDDALFGASDEPAILDGYGTVPAPWARALIANAIDGTGGVDRHAGAWIRRLYTAPDTGAFVAMESRTRFMPPGLRDLIRFRDQRCRIPWCDGTVAHIDHLDRHADAGPTSEANGAGLCAAHNLDRETPDYHHIPHQRDQQARRDRGQRNQGDRRSRKRQRRQQQRRSRHAFTIITPTGHAYTSTAPAPPGTDT